MSFIYKGSKEFHCNLECKQCSANTKQGIRCKKTTCKYLPTCYIHTKSKYHLAIRPSTIPNAGDGLFALKDFKKGEFISDYIGEELTQQNKDNRYGNTQQDIAPYAIKVSKNKIIDCACTRSIGSYANHKKGNINASISVYMGKAEIKASKNIKDGQEIFISYGRDYWNHQGAKHKTRKSKGGINV